MLSNTRVLNALTALAALALVVLAVVYFAEPASSLPSWVPGHETGSAHHHVKHGIAAAVVALGLGVLVWFRTGPQAHEVAGR
ncbi:MAG: hypothetical protein H6531_05675 [Actinobacteria bacterium]|nr:hypothetical protein [Thermoleophilia bacterium]MCB9011302.1 hypothetical protein [Actinomycetota bacterium]